MAQARGMEPDKPKLEYHKLDSQPISVGGLLSVGCSLQNGFTHEQIDQTL